MAEENLLPKDLLKRLASSGDKKSPVGVGGSSKHKRFNAEDFEEVKIKSESGNSKRNFGIEVRTLDELSSSTSKGATKNIRKFLNNALYSYREDRSKVLNRPTRLGPPKNFVSAPDDPKAPPPPPPSSLFKKTKAKGTIRKKGKRRVVKKGAK